MSLTKQHQQLPSTASSSLDSSLSSSEASMNRLSLPGSDTISSQSSRSSLTESIDAPTIPPILKSSSYYNLSSRATSASTSTVSFAPLPDLAPRKRKSNVQLGVAARSNMLRHRRMFMAAQEDALRPYDDGQEGVIMTSPPPIHSNIRSPSESAVMYVHGGTQGPRMVTPGGWGGPMDQLSRDPGLAEDAVEDAFLALGRMVKGAGKSLWRKMSVARRGSLDDVRSSREREVDEKGVMGSTSDVEDKKKKEGSKSKSRRRAKGWTSEDVAAVLASEAEGPEVVSLQAILEEDYKRVSSSPVHDPASEADEEVADIVLTDPNAPHPSEHIELPDTLPADFLNITQPSDEPCPPTTLPDLEADETDSETDESHSTAGRFELPATPPTEFASGRLVVGSVPR